MKIVIGGYFEKEHIASLVKGFQIDVEIMNDVQGAMALKQNQCDYYVGCCQTGAGGALAMAIALNGDDCCACIASVGHYMSEDEIKKLIQQGKRAFGMVPEAIDKVIPILCSQLQACRK